MAHCNDTPKIHKLTRFNLKYPTLMHPAAFISAGSRIEKHNVEYQLAKLPWSLRPYLERTVKHTPWGRRQEEMNGRCAAFPGRPHGSS